jgi:hypothetical protein
MSTLGKSYQQAMSQIDEMVKTAIEEAGDKQQIYYTAYETDQFDVPINNLEEIPVQGKIKFVDEDGEWESPILDSPTWLRIVIFANRMVIETEAWYRSFDDFDITDNQDGIMIAEFEMN